MGAVGSAAGQHAYTDGSPGDSTVPVSQISTSGNPVARRCAAIHSADARTSGWRAGSAEIDGILSHCVRSPKKLAAFSSM